MTTPFAGHHAPIFRCPPKRVNPRDDLVYPAGSGDGVVSVTLPNAAVPQHIRVVFRYQDGNNFWAYGTFGGVYRLARWGLGQGLLWGRWVLPRRMATTSS